MCLSVVSTAVSCGPEVRVTIVPNFTKTLEVVRGYYHAARIAAHLCSNVTAKSFGDVFGKGRHLWHVVQSEKACARQGSVPWLCCVVVVVWVQLVSSVVW